MDDDTWKKTTLMSSKYDIVVFKETNENWCGSYKLEDRKGLFLKVSFHWYFPSNNWMVTVWGNDDFGMGKYDLSQDEAMEIFMKVIKLPFVNQDDLYKLGFQIA